MEHNNPAQIILNAILGVNVALGKPAQQSTVFGDFDAYLAVDGDATNKAQMDQNSCIYTSDASGTTQAWWRVNLGQNVYSHYDKHNNKELAKWVDWQWLVIVYLNKK